MHPLPPEANAYVMERFSSVIDALGAWLICRDYPVDDETRDILETAVKTLQVLGGRVLLLQAQVHALEYGFYLLRRNGGLIGWKRRRPFEHLRKPILRVF